MPKLLGIDFQILYEIHENYVKFSELEYAEKFIEILGKLPIGEVSPQLDQFIIASLIKQLEKSKGDEGFNIVESPFLRINTPLMEHVLFFIDRVHFSGPRPKKKNYTIDDFVSKINNLASNIISLLVANEIIKNEFKIIFEFSYACEKISIDNINKIVNLDVKDDKVYSMLGRFKYNYSENINLLIDTKWIEPAQKETNLLLDIIYEQENIIISDLNLIMVKENLIAVLNDLEGWLL